jgi:hypothetical protein
MIAMLIVVMCLFCLGVIGWAVISINQRSRQWSQFDE